jgi:hypothetical protein
MYGCWTFAATTPTTITIRNNMVTFNPVIDEMMSMMNFSPKIIRLANITTKNGTTNWIVMDFIKFPDKIFINCEIASLPANVYPNNNAILCFKY